MCQWRFPRGQEHVGIINTAKERPQRGQLSITLLGKQMGTIKATLPACLGCSQEVLAAVQKYLLLSPAGVVAPSCILWD